MRVCLAANRTADETLLKSYETDLVGKGCTLASDCIRTWIFVQNVDVNYAGIVKARRENFLGQGLTESTIIYQYRHRGTSCRSEDTCAV